MAMKRSTLTNEEEKKKQNIFIALEILSKNVSYQPLVWKLIRQLKYLKMR